MGFVSLYEREFGGRKWAQWEALRVCGVDAATRVLRAGRDAALERELQRVWRDKVRRFLRLLFYSSSGVH